MDFIFDRHSPLPAHVQIQEQIKLGLLLGRLRPGDTLPSIRDVEQQAGVSRNLVRKAYLELQSSGILNFRHGKRVVVDKNLRYEQNGQINLKCERLTREIIDMVRRMGISPTSFGRYFYQHARIDEAKLPFIMYVDATSKMAEERASKISTAWKMDIPGISIDDLKKMDRTELKKFRRVLTNYLRNEQVLDIINGRKPEVIPLGLSFEPATVKEWSAFPPGSSVIFVLDDRDYPSLALIIELYRRILLEPSVDIAAVRSSQIPDLKRFLRSNQYHKVIFSNRIWENLPDEVRRHPKATYPRMTVDLGSLENARISAGVIV